MRGVLTLILAGGKGSRLEPLTRDRAKPAVPFGGLYRIIDFALSNCINSGLRKLLVLTQYKARSLDRHIGAAWGFLSRELNDYVEVLPPQQPKGLPNDPGTALASMGIYVFTARNMYELLCQDATKPESDHDFGKNIIPMMMGKFKVMGFSFRDKNRKATAYWRDVGTLDA